MHAEVTDALTPGRNRSTGAFGDPHKMIRPERSGFIVDRDGAAAGPDEHQHIDFVIDVRPDLTVSIEANQVGVKVAPMRQTPY